MTERSLFYLSLISLSLAVPQTAAAHVGHVGDLAGHSHWVGVAALGGAAVLAAWLAIRSKNNKEEEPTPWKPTLKPLKAENS
ncbi:MAG: DUF6732 family protein [Stappiaceae bacterium]